MKEPSPGSFFVGASSCGILFIVVVSRCFFACILSELNSRRGLPLSTIIWAIGGILFCNCALYSTNISGNALSNF